jgi:2-dehydropantoate 2-reductase
VTLTETASHINTAMKILCFGAGAIGTYVGGSLALAGSQVVFLERENNAAHLREKGLRLDLTADSRRQVMEASVVHPRAIVPVSTLEDALRYGPFDLAIFALKSYDTVQALEALKPFASKLPPILCLSNGVANEPTMGKVLGIDKVLYGTVTTAVGKRGVGDIVLERVRGVGIAQSHPLAERLFVAFENAFLNPRLFEDAASMKWSKLLTNLLANATSAILNMTPAEVFANRALYKIEIAMLRECLEVMQAQSIPVVDLPGTPVRALAFATRLPIWISKPFLSRAAGAGRGGKMPSFHIDLWSERGKSEVEYLNGEVARAGKRLNIPTPVNSLLTETLLALTRREMPINEFSRNPQKLVARLKS